jgi:hypothetical protein
LAHLPLNQRICIDEIHLPLFFEQIGEKGEAVRRKVPIARLNELDISSPRELEASIHHLSGLFSRYVYYLEFGILGLQLPRSIEEENLKRALLRLESIESRRQKVPVLFAQKI